MTFIVNSSPGAGLRFEPSAFFADAKAALVHAERLSLRGMRLIRARETETGEIYDVAGLRRHIAGVENARAKE